MSNNKEGHVHWMDAVSKDYKLDEEIRKNPGFGKPLPNSLFKGDTYSNFLKTAKDAGYLPSWVNLQKEIRSEIANIINVIEENLSEEKLNSLIDEINVKIMSYNKQCPPQSQKGKIKLESIKSQYEFWK